MNKLQRFGRPQNIQTVCHDVHATQICKGLYVIQSSLFRPKNSKLYIYIYIYIYTPLKIRTQWQRHSNLLEHAHMHPHRSIYMPTHANKHKIYPYTDKCLPAHKHTSTHICNPSPPNTCTYTHIHAARDHTDKLKYS